MVAAGIRRPGLSSGRGDFRRLPASRKCAQVHARRVTALASKEVAVERVADLLSEHVTLRSASVDRIGVHGYIQGRLTRVAWFAFCSAGDTGCRRRGALPKTTTAWWPSLSSSPRLRAWRLAASPKAVQGRCRASLPAGGGAGGNTGRCFHRQDPGADPRVVGSHPVPAGPPGAHRLLATVPGPRSLVLLYLWGQRVGSGAGEAVSVRPVPAVDPRSRMPRCQARPRKPANT